jgi:hypothetical protein
MIISFAATINITVISFFFSLYYLRKEISWEGSSNGKMEASLGIFLGMFTLLLMSLIINHVTWR